MRVPRLRSLLIAFAFGAAVGAGATTVEALLSRPGPPTEAFAAYALIGGAIALVARTVLGGMNDAVAGPRCAVFTVTAFAAVEILYIVNVRLLPGEHYLSARSLVVEGMALGFVTLAAVLLLRARALRDVRRRWEHPMTWAGSAVMALALAFLIAHGPWATADARTDRAEGPDLLLIVIDSARRDHLGLYGYPRQTSPQLEAVTTGARIFENAYAAASWTVPSVAQLMTGRLDGKGEGPALADTLARRGYATACFTDNPHLDRSSHLLRGFGSVRRSVGSWRRAVRGTVVGNVVERLDPGDDARLVDEALAWAQRTPGAKFLYVHLMDSHAPYRWGPIDGQTRPGRRIEFPVTRMRITDDEAADVVSRYDGGVRSATEQAARLLRAAQGWGRAYLAIVTADHGESLGEHGRWFHGGSLAPELLAVPLIVTGTGVTTGRTAAPVGHEAIRTTLLAAGGAVDGGVADLRTGSGLGMVEGGLPPDLAYRVSGSFQVLVDGTRGSRHLFRLDDVTQERDLANERPEMAAILAEGLVPGVTPHAPLAEVRERLRAIGYVD